MLAHRYINASDDPAAYAADQCRRQAATVAWVLEHWPADAALWSYDAEAAQMGLDPWRMIEIDHAQGNRYLISTNAGRATREVPGDTRIFVQLRDLPAGMTPPAGPPVWLTEQETLIYYDGPLLVTARDPDGHAYIAVAIDAPVGRTTWMAARVPDAALTDVLANRTPLRDLFTEHRAGALLTGTFDEDVRALFVHRADAGDSELPEPGVHLHPET